MSFAEVLSFSGLLPELINSRAAMLGMLAAFGAELATRQPVFLQVGPSPTAHKQDKDAVPAALSSVTWKGQVVLILPSVTISC